MNRRDKILKFIYILSFAILILGCERKKQSVKINEIPVFDQAYYTNALASINESIDDQPDNPDSHYKKALVLIELNKYNSAIESLKNALSLDNSMVEYHFKLAQAYILIGEPEKAVSHAKIAESMGMNSTEFFTLMTDIYLYGRDYKKGFAYINKAISASPGRSHNYYLKGVLQLETSDTTLAEESFKKTIQLDSLHKDAYQKLIRIKIAQGNYEEAMAITAKALKHFPNNEEILFDQISIYRKTGLYDSAKKEVRKILIAQPQNLRAIQNLGFILYEEKKYDSAELYIEKLLSIDSEDKTALFALASIYDRKKNYSLALEQYEKILKIDSANQTATTELSKLKAKILYQSNLAKKKASLSDDRETEPKEGIGIQPIEP